jgi:cyclophilin family peptidyl-prolyl cis-trans isomerase
VIRKLFSRNVATSNPTRAARRPALEPLEGRTLMHNTFITSVIADNRGEVLIQFEPGASEIAASLFNKNSVQMYLAGPDGHVGTADDQRAVASIRFTPSNQRLLVRGHDIPAGNGYRIKVVSSRIPYASGFRMDGEFSGTFPTGNGVAGGNFEFQVKNDRSSTPRVRMSTSDGVMTLRMRGDVAPATVSNFLTYANDRDFDNTFFTRSIPDFIIQGGSLQIDSSNTIVEGQVRDPVVNEFNISNTRGMISMAKQGGNPNSATNQFFFNLGDNSGNLDNQNGGFTVFAEVLGANGLAVMDAIAGRPIVALRNDLTGDGVVPSFAATGVTDTPVLSTNGLTGENQVVDGQGTERFVVTGGFDPSADLIVIRRVAPLMRVARL